MSQTNTTKQKTLQSERTGSGSGDSLNEAQSQLLTNEKFREAAECSSLSEGEKNSTRFNHFLKHIVLTIKAFSLVKKTEKTVQIGHQSIRF